MEVMKTCACLDEKVMSLLTHVERSDVFVCYSITFMLVSGDICPVEYFQGTGLFKPGSLPILQSLHIKHSVLQDEQVAEILNSSLVLTPSKPRATLFGSWIFRSLVQHFSYLRCFELQATLGVSSMMVQQVLTAYPVLGELAAEKVDVKHILGDVEGADQQDTAFHLQDYTYLNLRMLRIFSYGLSDKSLE
ncbi:hypothetical protein BC939DRAFT_515891 [Gamsiella multidivaricata]|uniref:uncharacterized protein n=1 Tax=Gamsiella multidivaricata TaxID=101098 RepID=UPI00221E921D|nr:uncharacterized protein BC939DRAFT_515891 [Gamsiella multidivaricata]KAI7831641.1 hypothetical protein BC939DRAFT_515891 [Gamsiella multidivaricata]